MVAFSGFYESQEPPPSGDARGIVPVHRHGHRNDQQSGFILHRRTVCCRPGCRRGNTERVVARWRRLVASIKALDLLHRVMRAGRNMFGTCFGETGLKIRPDVFRHDNCEQKKHVLLCKMSPASHFFLFEKGKKNNK